MIEAETIVLALGGDWRSSHGLAACPICQPEARRDQRGLSVKNSGGRTLLTCHKAGCSAPDIFAELRSRSIIRGHGEAVTRPAAEIERERKAREAQRRRTQAFCDDLFASALPITNTPAETYLAGRGIVVQGSKLKRTLRFHPGLKHSGTGEHLPAMVARIRGPKGHSMGLHRTYLRPDGSDKADLPGGAKLMLGAASGGAVRFGPDRPVIALAEGIETALSIGLASRLTVWACLSTSGLKGLILPPPPVAEVIVIAADNDPAGLDAAEKATERFEAEGRAVSVITPKTEGADFNDVLRARPHE